MFDDLFTHLSSNLEAEHTSLWDTIDHSIDSENPLSDSFQPSFDPLDSDSITWQVSPLDLPVDAWSASDFDGLGDPITDAAYWQKQQGQNSCAVVAQISVYEAITGQDLSEVDACRFAEANGWFDPNKGTQPENIGKLLAALGIPTHQTYDATLEDIAIALEQGDKVIVGLDAQEIWQPLRDPITGEPIEQPPAGHAVWVTGIDQQPDGSIKLILNDSGTPDGQMMTVDAHDFLNAWQDFGNLMVVADAPNPIAVA